MLNHRMDDVEDQEVGHVFHSYPCAYYVQSPSTISHANSAADIRNIHNIESTFHSPPNPNHDVVEASRFTLSRYSSSRGSNNSFLHEKKVAYDAQSHGTGTENGENPLINIVDHGGVLGDDDDDDDDDHDHENGHEDDKKEYMYYGRKKRGCWRSYCTYRNSDSCLWICLQICWRAMVSLGVALIVFYLATKPPPPKVSVKVAGIRQFVLAEGVDASGVATKILTCNCSIDLMTENNSKLFGLHIHPLIIEMSFGRLPFAMSYSPELYAERGSTLYKVSVGTRNKAMYGAGRSMEDMLESGRGLPLVIRMRLSSSFRVVSNLVRPQFHHQAECLLVLGRAYDKKHRTQSYNSSCTITS